MNTLFARLQNLDHAIANLNSRITIIEDWLGLPKSAPKQTNTKTKTRKANREEGQRIRAQLLHVLLNRKQPMAKRIIAKKVRTASDGALSWYLQDLRKQGKIKMTKRGHYIGV